MSAGEAHGEFSLHREVRFAAREKKRKLQSLHSAENSSF
jgi:hypothetical protein